MRNPIQLIKDSFSILGENPQLLVGITIIPLLFSYLLEFLAPAQSGAVNIAEWSIYLSLILVSAVLNVLMAAAIIFAVNDRTLTIGVAYKKAMCKFWSYIWLSIVSSVLIGLGFMLFIIPGVILSVWFAFAAMVLVLENRPAVESLKASRNYVKGKWWTVAIRLAIGVLLMILVFVTISLPAALLGGYIAGAAGLIVTVVLTPVAVGYIYLMYKDVKGSALASSTSSEPVATPATNDEMPVSNDSDVATDASAVDNTMSDTQTGSVKNTTDPR